jgi:hypothetical protein
MYLKEDAVFHLDYKFDYLIIPTEINVHNSYLRLSAVSIAILNKSVKPLSSSSVFSVSGVVRFSKAFLTFVDKIAIFIKLRSANAPSTRIRCVSSANAPYNLILLT